MLLFAAREVTQESLGFSPAELVFGHTVRGPMKLLKEMVGKPVPLHKFARLCLPFSVKAEQGM